MLTRLLPLLLLLSVATTSAAEPDPRKPKPAPPPEEADEAVVRGLIDRAATGEAPSADAFPADDPRRPILDEWLKHNAEALTGVTKSPLPEQPWGQVTMKPGKENEPTRLYLHVFYRSGRHSSGKLIVYGLAGEAKAALPVTRTGRDTVLSPPWQQQQLPQDFPFWRPETYVVETDGPPKVVPLAVGPAEDGTVTLHAKDVVVHGLVVRYEPEPHKNTVGYWTRQEDWVRWELDIKHPGAYAVQILQGCGPGSGGSEVEMSVGDAADQMLRFTVQETKGFQDFIARDVGKLTFPEAGVYSLKVKPLRKPGVAVMDLRMVMLKPSAE